MSRSGYEKMLLQHGKPCVYCARTMNIEDPGLRPTRDHHVPKSKGGKVIVWCCFVCNAVKRDLTPDEWALYRATHDEWWLGGRAQRALNWRPNPRGELSKRRTTHIERLLVALGLKT